MATINEKLEHLISLKLDELEPLQVSSDDFGAGVDSICKLSKLLQEDKKIEYDFDDKTERRKIEEERLELDKNKFNVEKNCSNKFDKKELIFKGLEYGIKLTAVVLPAVFYGNWMKRGFEFEKDGILCSKTFMGFANKIPKP